MRNWAYRDSDCEWCSIDAGRHRHLLTAEGTPSVIVEIAENGIYPAHEAEQEAGAYWCASHRRHTTDPVKCLSRRGGILLPCSVERDYGRNPPGWDDL